MAPRSVIGQARKPRLEHAATDLLAEAPAVELGAARAPQFRIRPTLCSFDLGMRIAVIIRYTGAREAKDR
jgi:hypothetical protein